MTHSTPGARVFPLPAVPVPPPVRSCSRRCRSRRSHSVAVARLVNLSVSALNNTATSFASSTLPTVASQHTTQSQHRALTHITSCVERFVRRRQGEHSSHCWSDDISDYYAAVSSVPADGSESAYANAMTVALPIVAETVSPPSQLVPCLCLTCFRRLWQGSTAALLSCCCLMVMLVSVWGLSGTSLLVLVSLGQPSGTSLTVLGSMGLHSWNTRS
jgi:hypothetical protein